jgi:hypothetical protein
VSVVTDTRRNGVDTEKVFATLELIKAQPELARFQLRATKHGIDGAHNRSTIEGFYAAGGEAATRSREFEIGNSIACERTLTVRELANCRRVAGGRLDAHPMSPSLIHLTFAASSRTARENTGRRWRAPLTTHPRPRTRKAKRVHPDAA